MNDYLKRYADYMDQHGVKYHLWEDGDTVSVTYDMRSGATLTVHLHFDEDGDGKVDMSVVHLGKFSAERLVAGLLTCNDLNQNFRWVKFYLDSDNEACARCDAIIDLETVGDECFELMQRMLHIVDDALPDLKRALGE